jgi:glucose-1-phosphate thymidylyltransferase
MKSKTYKGIVLAGGSGTRLFPMTKGICKQLLPIYDKPMIYYPLSVLMLAGIRDILIISTPDDTPVFEKLLGDGKQLGINISYKVQEKPNGLAQAFILGEEFIGNDNVCLILGDNIFHGPGFEKLLKSAVKSDNATVFGYYVKDPSRFGVVEFNTEGKAISIEEKPKNPRSNYAVTGLYFYDNSVIDISKKLKPSRRGEYEITDINKEYLKQGKLNVEVLGRGFAWLDTGTPEALIDAANYVKTVQDRQGLMIACLEEIAYNKRYITRSDLIDLYNTMSNSEYGKYIYNLTYDK